MKQYSSERKEAVLRKLAPPANRTIPEVAEAEGISTATLYRGANRPASEDRFCHHEDPLRKAGAARTSSVSCSTPRR